MSDSAQAEAPNLPRFLRLQTEGAWHIRNAKVDSISQPLCTVRYGDPDYILGADNPVREPICEDCGMVYLRDVNDHPALTAALLTTMAFSQHIKANPLYARHLGECEDSANAFEIIQSYVYSTSTFLIQSGAPQLVEPLIQHMLTTHVPGDVAFLLEERLMDARKQAAQDLAAAIAKVAPSGLGCQCQNCVAERDELSRRN